VLIIALFALLTDIVVLAVAVIVALFTLIGPRVG
jgi:hypothetical protein